MNYRYYNIYKNQYKIATNDACLIIGQTSCCKVTRETALLIDELPLSGSRELFIEKLLQLKINNPSGIFETLQSIGVLVTKDDYKGIGVILKKIFNAILHPRILVIPCAIQEKLFQWIPERYHEKVKSDKVCNRLLHLYWIIAVVTVAISITINYFPLTLYTKSSLVSNSSVDGVLYGIALILGVVIHEIGHSLMCHSCGIGYRPISFSVFLFFPVFFTNVSGMEVLDLKRRLLINGAGLFFQSFYTLLIFILFSATHLAVFYTVTKSLIYLFLFNLHPFIRTDGFWVYNDVLSRYKSKPVSRVINGIYYVFYAVFSLYLLHKVYLLFTTVIYYFLHYTMIRLDMHLLVNIFYAYLGFFLIKAVMRRLKYVYDEFVRPLIVKVA